MNQLTKESREKSEADIGVNNDYINNIILLFSLCSRLPPKLGETAEVYRQIDRLTPT